MRRNAIQNTVLLLLVAIRVLATAVDTVGSGGLGRLWRNPPAAVSPTSLRRRGP